VIDAGWHEAPAKRREMVEGDCGRQCLVSRRFWVAMVMLLMAKLTPGSEK